jgi:predicted alpha/beta-hydrolase family hydrolase
MAVSKMTPAAQPFFREWAEGPAVRGFLHRPAGGPANGLVLAHGAGGNAAQSTLAALCAAFAQAGFLALRIDLPFRQARASGSPYPAQGAADRLGIERAAGCLAEMGAGKVVIGGHSYGGRQASMLAAEKTEIASALLFLSYPLHPPGKPDQQRSGHFPGIKAPCVFVHGTRDPFGTLDEMRSALALLRARHELMEVTGGDHGLRAAYKPEGLARIINAVQNYL